MRLMHARMLFLFLRIVNIFYISPGSILQQLAFPTRAIFRHLYAFEHAILFKSLVKSIDSNMFPHVK